VSEFETDPEFKSMFTGVVSNAAELALSRCSSKACGFSGVILIPNSSIERVPESGMVWYEDITHAIACHNDPTTCHYVQNPEEITRVFGDAINITLQEQGVIGLLHTDTQGLSQDN
jgi:hypothetical protein